MANIRTIIIRQSLNRNSRLSLFINIGFNIVAYLPFFLVRIAVFGLIIPFLSYLINF